MNNNQNAVAPSENISRFILHSGHYAKNKSRVKWAAFIPPKNVLELSVYRTSGISDDQIWEIGNEKVAQPRDLILKARADLLASEITDTENLSIIPDTTPHKLHANIEGWPDSRSKQKLIAIKLADKSNLKLFTS